MKKSRDMIALFLVCVLFLTACGKDKKPAQGEPGIYYVNVEGTGLVKEEIPNHSNFANPMDSPSLQKY